MKTETRIPRRVSWWEPRWSFVPRVKWELRRLLSPRLWIRVLVIVTIVVIPLAAYVQAHVPGLQFNWPLALLQSFELLGIQLTVMSSVVLFLPPRVSVTRRAIFVQHGNSARNYPVAKIDGADLTLHRGGKFRLWITCAGRSSSYGIGPSVDISALRAILGEKLTVHDYRYDHDGIEEMRFRIAS